MCSSDLTAYPWQEQRGMRACHAARRRGALLRPLGDVVVIMPPLAISLEEIDRLAEATEQGIMEATQAAAARAAN